MPNYDEIVNGNYLRTARVKLPDVDATMPVREYLEQFLEFLDGTTNDVDMHNRWTILDRSVTRYERGRILTEDFGCNGYEANCHLDALDVMSAWMYRALEVATVDDDALSEIVRGYIDAQLWTTSYRYLDNDTTTDDDVSPSDRGVTFDDVRPEYVERVRCDVLEFVTRHPLAVRMYFERRRYDAAQGTVAEYFGHDFLLTRDGHGTGFWDRDYGAAWNDAHSVFRSEFGDYLTACVDKLRTEFGESGDIESAIPPRPASEFDGESVTLSTWTADHIAATVTVGADRQTVTVADDNGERIADAGARLALQTPGTGTVEFAGLRLPEHAAREVSRWLDAWLTA